MRGFKEQVKRDIKTVFHNPDEHADMTRVRYNGADYEIPVIFDYDVAKERSRLSSDHADGVFLDTFNVFISQYDLDIVPRKETNIEVGGETYNIVKVSCDAGEIRLELEMMDE